MLNPFFWPQVESSSSESVQGPRKHGLVVTLVISCSITHWAYALKVCSVMRFMEVTCSLVHAEYLCQQTTVPNSLISLLTARPGPGVTNPPGTQVGLSNNRAKNRLRCHPCESAPCLPTGKPSLCRWCLTLRSFLVKHPLRFPRKQVKWTKAGASGGAISLTCLGSWTFFFFLN